MALHGSDGQRVENMAWRKAHLPTMIADEHGFTLIYLDESIEKPIAAQMTGIRLERVLTEEELWVESNCSAKNAKNASTDPEPAEKPQKLWAKVRLPSQFTDLCGLKAAYLQVDDHLGAEKSEKEATRIMSPVWLTQSLAALCPPLDIVLHSAFKLSRRSKEGAWEDNDDGSHLRFLFFLGLLAAGLRVPALSSRRGFAR